MINTLSLLFSLVTVGFIVVRAAMLDKVHPWFKPPPDPAATPRQPRRYGR